MGVPEEVGVVAAPRGESPKSRHGTTWYFLRKQHPVASRGFQEFVPRAAISSASMGVPQDYKRFAAPRANLAIPCGKKILVGLA